MKRDKFQFFFAIQSLLFLALIMLKDLKVTQIIKKLKFEVGLGEL